jgi:methyl-accepting chemotaxis protein
MALLPRRSLGAVLVATLVLAGVLPVLASVALMTADARQRSTDADHATADRLAGSTARELSRAFGEWAGELLVAAQNDALRAYYRTPSRRVEFKRQIDASLVGLHAVHPDLIDEACYIDARGPERARMVRGSVAGPSDLSPDESGNPFFAASFAVPVGAVHQHTPYVSPDSGTWVVSNATPIEVNGRKVAILHFETEIEGLRRRIAALMPAGAAARVVDASSGVLVFDTRTPVVKPDTSGDIARDRLPEAGKLQLGQGLIAGAADVAVLPQNLNRWRVEVVTPPAPNSETGLGLQVAALVVVVVAGLLITAFVLTRRIVRPLQAVTTQAERLAAGDLTGSVHTDRQDEIGRVARAVDGATSALRSALRNIRANSSDLAGVADGVEVMGHQLTQSSHVADDESRTVQLMATHLGTTTSALSERVDELGTSAGEIETRAGEAAQVAADGARLADETTALVGQLVEASETIEDVVQVISGVTAQTRLLALNATIEAARAGEHGRGFAVVANEVKTLAEETQHATDQISGRVESLRRTAASAAVAIERITGSIALVDRAQQAITEAVGRQSGLAQAMRSELSALSGDATTMVEGSARVTQASALTRQAVDESAAAAARLSTIADEMRDLVQTFVVD